jgi:hypothetical protein
MKVIGDFNNISKEMKAMMPKLKAGEVKTFIKVNGVINRDPEEKYRRKSPVLYSTEQIPTRARIRDWHTGDFVDVGVPERFSKNEVLSTRFFMPGLGEHHFKNTGMFSLSGDKIEDVELYEYLSLCNENEGNKYRDKSVQAVFKEMNVAADSKAVIQDVDTLMEALQTAKGMSVVDATQFGAALMWPSYDEVTIKAKVMEYARQYPADFLEKAADEGTREKAELKMALDKDIIEYDPMDSTMKLGQSVLTKLDIREGSNFIEAFYEFTQSAANGRDIIKTIRKQLTAKAKEEKAVATV